MAPMCVKSFIIAYLTQLSAATLRIAKLMCYFYKGSKTRLDPKSELYG